MHTERLGLVKAPGLELSTNTAGVRAPSEKQGQDVGLCAVYLGPLAHCM